MGGRGTPLKVVPACGGLARLCSAWEAPMWTVRGATRPRRKSRLAASVGIGGCPDVCGVRLLLGRLGVPGTTDSEGIGGSRGRGGARCGACTAPHVLLARWPCFLGTRSVLRAGKTDLGLPLDRPVCRGGMGHRPDSARGAWVFGWRNGAGVGCGPQGGVEAGGRFESGSGVAVGSGWDVRIPDGDGVVPWR